MKSLIPLRHELSVKKKEFLDTDRLGGAGDRGQGKQPSLSFLSSAFPLTYDQKQN
ncbi:hypothetical protein VCR12J2_1060059 [Vibrio coralliirubri]|nr:hypothetical protein VCR12J2_1060059 [Vibrio coralliirubri]